MKHFSSAYLLFAFSPLLTLSLSFYANAADAGMITSADRTFVHKVGLGGMYEVNSSKLAQEKGQSQEVRDFSANEVKDHVPVGDKLKAIAESKGIAVPMQPDSEHAAMLDSLKAKSGEAFDKAYLKDMVTIHDMDEALFLKEARTTKDPDFKAFAAKTAKIVKGHIEMLHQIGK